MAIPFFSREAAKPAVLINIRNIRVASPCPADWNTMAGDERMRHCSECNLNVYNLSAMTEREVQRLVANSQGRVCGRFYRRADGTMLTQDCPRGLRAVARRVSRTVAAVLTAVMSVSVAFAGTKPKSQQGPQTPSQTEYKEPGIALTVTDPSGAVVTNAQVTLTDKKGKKKKSGVTNAMGQIFMVAPPAEDYSLKIDAAGFKHCEKTVPVHEGKVENITIKLPVEESAMVGVLVDGGPEMIQHESAVSTTFERPSLMTVMPSRGQYQPLR